MIDHRPSTPDILSALRGLMDAQGLNAYILPSNDPHNSEYPAAHWALRTYVSGFTGSAGTLVVTLDQAALWTDGRYFVQAEEELAGSGISLMKSQVAGTPSQEDWLSQVLPEGGRVGICADVCIQHQYDRFTAALSRAGLDFVLTDDLMKDIWSGRPDLSEAAVIRHEDSFAGRTVADKLANMRERMKEEGVNTLFVSALDEIGWLLNLRGYDVPFNPVFYAYLVLRREEAVLFMDEKKLPNDVRTRLDQLQIKVMPYDAIIRYADGLVDHARVWADPRQINARIWQALGDVVISTSPSPLRHAKAIKNDTEVKHLRRVMVKDGVALLRAKRRLDARLASGQMSEHAFGEVIAEERSKMPHYYGESFNAIVGYKGNGAIIHYRAPEEGSAMIANDGILLCDSGGQYHDGTTDITRTWAMGAVTDVQKRHYTLVLKGHIALARIRFPRGTRGVQLDTLARQYLWQDQINFKHGTGHGVGFFMNVHEPPQGFAPVVTDRGLTVHEPGMYSSNEPGYYEVGAYGIRLENLVICVKADEHGAWLRHETITLYPFDTALIDLDLMTDEEVAWLNSYHRKVLKWLSPELTDEERRDLERQCRALSR